jgi:hypothetical protein
VPGSCVSFTNERPGRDTANVNEAAGQLLRSRERDNPPWKLNSGIPVIHRTTRDESSKKPFCKSPISVALWKSSASRNVPLPTPDVTIIRRDRRNRVRKRHGIKKSKVEYVSQKPPLSYLVSRLIINIMLSVYRVIFIDLVAIRCHKLLRVTMRSLTNISEE